MQIEEGFVLSKNKQEIYTRTWNPPKSTRIIATVTFVHGLGENCCRYDHVFSVFADAGIKVASFDQRGFGQTGRRDGVLGHNEGLKTVLEDISECSNRVRLPNVPHFLFGHSMVFLFYYRVDF